MPTSSSESSVKPPPIRIFLIQSGSSVTNLNVRPKSTVPPDEGVAVAIGISSCGR